MKGWRSRVSSLGRSLLRSDQLDAAMGEEMRFHLDMEAERLMRERGLDAREARRQARVAFGGVEKYKEEGRAVWGLQWIDAASLDLRLGVRMLVKHRGLTLVGGLAMAVAIAIGATFFEVVTESLDPVLPLEDGERVVALQYATETPGGSERRVLRDFAAWRQEIKSVEQLGAFRTAQHTLVLGQESPEPIKVAEITASGFAVARTPPLLGRYLLPTDERDDGAAVMVIGYRAWQARFGGDPHVVGRTVSLGGAPSTVVGVMPDGFEFPLDHQFWIPLRANPLEYGRLQGPEIFMFGRLAGGVTMEEAQAELTILGQRAAAAHPDTHGRLRLVVLPYTHEPLGITSPSRAWLLRIVLLLGGALSFVVAVNLAILVYARTVTRLGEITVRTALGATRRRILAQLFIEALVLSVVGAGTGLVLSQLALGRMQSLVRANGSVPFWIDLELSAGTVVYAIALAVFAAVIMGVLPGLKATGSCLNASLRELNGRTGARLGPLWTTLVVGQVGVAVAVLPMAVYVAGHVMRIEAGPGFAAQEFVVGAVALGDEAAAVGADRVRGRQLELMSRLEAEPGVSAVTFSSSVPGFAGSRRLRFEDGVAAMNARSSEASTVDVDLDMFDVYGAGLLAGRAFTAADLGAANAVIVNRTFVREYLAKSEDAHRRELEPGIALGVRFRYASPTGSPVTQAQNSYQIVGVVRDFPSFRPSPGSEGEPTVYHPAAPGDLHPFVLSVRFDGNVPAGFIERFRKIGAEVDLGLQLRQVVPLSDFYDQLRSFWRYLAWGMGLVTLSVLLLSAAGIYALMSFTVAQRTREIAIRAALGAAPHRLLLSIFGRATRQLALGVLVGSLLSCAVFLNSDLGVGRASTLLFTVAAVMLTVGLLATLGPARRGLRIQPSDALRADT